MIIGIDFDGTCVVHKFPLVGGDIGAAPVLLDLVKRGHQLILWTMRCDNRTGGYEKYLTDAVNWFNENGIGLYGINTNPTQREWTTSPKAHCHLVIDDISLGIPLINGHVDWDGVRKLLEERNIL